jgi:hypothetical protein
VKTFTATFSNAGQVFATAHVSFAVLPSESLVRWSGNAARLAAALRRESLPAILYAGTAETTLRRMAEVAGCAVAIAAAGDWQELDE